MKKKVSVFIRSVLPTFIFLLSACQFDNSAVFSDECTPPCWRQIEPGETRTTEVKKKVEGFTDVVKESIIVVDKPWYIFSGYIDFSLTTGEEVKVYLLDGVVAMIDFTNQEGIASFEKCIEKFGSPKYALQSKVIGPGLLILPTSNTYHTWFYVLDPQRGIVFGYDTFSVFGDDLKIAPDTLVSVITFFDVNHLEDLIKTDGLIVGDNEDNLAQEKLSPWVGYGNIDELYPVK